MKHLAVLLTLAFNLISCETSPQAQQMIGVEVTSDEASGIERNELVAIDNLIGLPESEIIEKFGTPDEIEEDGRYGSITWTYISRVEGNDDMNLPITSYNTFAIWNGKVAGFQTKQFSDEQQAKASYDSAIGFMGEEERSVVPAANADTSMFTENLRFARRGDNGWSTDFYAGELESSTLLRVGDVGFHGCDLILDAEAKRIEKKYGVSVDSLLSSVDRRSIE